MHEQSGDAAPVCEHGALRGDCGSCRRAAALADATRPLSPVRGGGGGPRLIGAAGASLSPHRHARRERADDHSAGSSGGGRDSPAAGRRGARGGGGSGGGAAPTPRRASLDTRIRAILEEPLGGGRDRPTSSDARHRTVQLTLAAARGLLAPWGAADRAAAPAGVVLPRGSRARSASTPDLGSRVRLAAVAVAEWRSPRACGERSRYRINSLAAARTVAAAAASGADGSGGVPSVEYLRGLRVRLEGARKAIVAQDSLVRDLSERAGAGERSTTAAGSSGGAPVGSGGAHVSYWERRRMIEAQPSDDGASTGMCVCLLLWMLNAPPRRLWCRVSAPVCVCCAESAASQLDTARACQVLLNELLRRLRMKLVVAVLWRATARRLVVEGALRARDARIGMLRARGVWAGLMCVPRLCPALLCACVISFAEQVAAYAVPLPAECVSAAAPGCCHCPVPAVPCCVECVHQKAVRAVERCRQSCRRPAHAHATMCVGNDEGGRVCSLGTCGAVVCAASVHV